MWSRAPRRRDVENLLRHSESLNLSREAKVRLHWFAYVLAHDGNVSLTCRYFGISRSTFDRWASRFDPRKPETLEERSRRPHHVRAPETPTELIALIRQYRMETPVLGKEQIARLLRSEHGIALSASSVGRVIARNKFFFAESASHTTKRQPLDLQVDRAARRTTATSSLASVPEVEDGGAWPVADFPVFGS